MASNDEGQGSGDCNVYAVANAYLNLLDEQWLLQGSPVTFETGTDAETNISAETGADMLLLFWPSLSLFVAQLYMLHIINSCDDAGA